LRPRLGIRDILLYLFYDLLKVRFLEKVLKVTALNNAIAEEFTQISCFRVSVDGEHRIRINRELGAFLCRRGSSHGALSLHLPKDMVLPLLELLPDFLALPAVLVLENVLRVDLAAVHLIKDLLFQFLNRFLTLLALQNFVNHFCICLFMGNILRSLYRGLFLVMVRVFLSSLLMMAFVRMLLLLFFDVLIGVVVHPRNRSSEWIVF